MTALWEPKQQQNHAPGLCMETPIKLTWGRDSAWYVLNDGGDANVQLELTVLLIQGGGCLGDGGMWW